MATLSAALVLLPHPVRAAAAGGDPSGPPPMPRLMLAAGPLIGPHASGEATCQSRGGVSLCEHTGNFLGVGGHLELRGQLYGPLYLHVRGLVLGNVRPRPYGVHSGLGGGGIGLGAYSRLAFIRAEYMFVPTLGPSTYRPPFYEEESGRDRWGRHAGMISAGVRKYATPRLAAELWAGLVIGPRSQRTSLSQDAAQTRTLISFMVSIGLAFDVLPARGWKPPVKGAPAQPAANPPPAPTSPQPAPQPFPPTAAPQTAPVAAPQTVPPTAAPQTAPVAAPQAVPPAAAPQTTPQTAPPSQAPSAPEPPTQTAPPPEIGPWQPPA